MYIRDSSSIIVIIVMYHTCVSKTYLRNHNVEPTYPRMIYIYIYIMYITNVYMLYYYL